MLFEIHLYERADGNNFELIEMGKVERGSGQLAAQAAFSHGFRNFCMKQPHGVAGAPVLQECSAFLQRDLKLAFGLIMFYRIAVHGPFAAHFLGRA